MNTPPVQNQLSYIAWPGTFKKTSSTEANQIIYLVLRESGFTRTELESKSRKRELTFVRHMAMYFLKKYSDMTLKEIGKIFGGRDHSSVSHARDTVHDLCFTNPAIKTRVQNLENVIKNQIVISQK